MTYGRPPVIQSLPETTVVIPKDTTRSLARMLAARRCRREKCCVQLFECWLPISETGSVVANRIYHRHSIATYARCARALCSAARHGSSRSTASNSPGFGGVLRWPLARRASAATDIHCSTDLDTCLCAL